MTDPKPSADTISDTDHHEKIPEPLTDRTLIHGRNIMAVSAIILALTFFPDINIDDFKPFGLKVSEKSLWIILAIVLTYYTVRFRFDCWVEYKRWKNALLQWSQVPTWGTVFTPEPPRMRVVEKTKRMFLRFWIFDFGIPIGMAVVALGTVTIKILSLS